MKPSTPKSIEYRRGYYAACDEILNEMNTIEENGTELRKILYQRVIWLKPDEKLPKDFK